MQELTFEQVEVVVGGSKIDDMERMNEARKASQKNINEDNESSGVSDLGAHTAIVGIGAALGRINPWVGVAGAMFSFYVVESPRSSGGTAYPTYQGGPHQVDPLL